MSKKKEHWLYSAKFGQLSNAKAKAVRLKRDEVLLSFVFHDGSSYDGICARPGARDIAGIHLVRFELIEREQIENAVAAEMGPRYLKFKSRHKKGK